MPTFHVRWEKLEKQRVDFLGMLRQYPDPVLNRPLAPGKWSPAQIVKHLILAEEHTLYYLEKKTKNTEGAPRSGLKAWIRSVALNFSLRSSFTFKAPALAVPDTKESSLESLEAWWNGERSHLHELLSKLPESDFKKELFRHPAVGKINLYQMLAFMEIHVDRHQKQIQKIMINY